MTGRRGSRWHHRRLSSFIARKERESFSFFLTYIGDGDYEKMPQTVIDLVSIDRSDIAMSIIDKYDIHLDEATMSLIIRSAEPSLIEYLNNNYRMFDHIEALCANLLNSPYPNTRVLDHFMKEEDFNLAYMIGMINDPDKIEVLLQHLKEKKYPVDYDHILSYLDRYAWQSTRINALSAIIDRHRIKW